MKRSLPAELFFYSKVHGSYRVSVKYHAVHTRSDLSVRKPCIAVSHPASIEVSPVCLGAKKKDP